MTQSTRSNLHVTPRHETGNGPNRRLRAAGLLPAVVYSKGKTPVAVTADPKAIVAHLHGPLGRNGAIDLQIEGEKDSRLAIVQEYTVHPWKRSLEHVDFWEINPDTVLTVTVPFAGEGRTEAETQGGRVRFTRDDIVVRCKPADVPARITFDMTALSFGDHNIHISQLPMPPGVTAHFKNDYSLIQVFVPKVSATAEPEAAEPKKGGKAPAKAAAKAPAKATAAKK
jgi:large subunit ribosomal protein L25